MESLLSFVCKYKIGLGIMVMLCFFYLRASQAQNMVYAQFESVPLLVNPAGPGLTSNPTLSFLQRTQRYGEGGQLSLSNASAVYPFYRASDQRHWASTGLHFSHDAGDFDQLFRFQSLGASFAYNLRLSQKNWLHIGLGGAWIHQSLSSLNFSTGSQWLSNYGYDVSRSNGENLSSESAAYYSLNSGLIWSLRDAQGKPAMYVGLALYHLNRPSDGFINPDTRINRRVSLNGGFRIWESRPWVISAEGLFQSQSKVNHWSAGTRCSYRFINENPFDLLSSGSMDLVMRYANSQSLQAVFQLQQKAYTIGWAYELRPSSNLPMPAMEVWISLRIPKKKAPVATQMLSDYSLGQVKRFYAQEEAREQGQGETASSAIAEQPDSLKAAMAFKFQLKRDFKFGFNDTELNEEAKAYLQEIAALLLATPSLKLEVIGHTDDIGSRHANRRVAYHRAEVVIHYLESVGIAADRMRPIARGNEEPLYPNDSESNRAKNRRVEFIIYTEE